jgi:tRNA A37 threonylcarbamoyladenosine synthetase subunit TsaC/SUA5/YrdC
MPFLATLIYDHKATQNEDDLFVAKGDKTIKVAICDHEAGLWVLTREGQALIAGVSAKEEPKSKGKINPVGLEAE